MTCKNYLLYIKYMSMCIKSQYLRMTLLSDEQEDYIIHLHV